MKIKKMSEFYTKAVEFAQYLRAIEADAKSLEMMEEFEPDFKTAIEPIKAVFAPQQQKSSTPIQYDYCIDEEALKQIEANNDKLKEAIDKTPLDRRSLLEVMNVITQKLNGTKIMYDTPKCMDPTAPIAEQKKDETVEDTPSEKDDSPAEKSKEEVVEPIAVDINPQQEEKPKEEDIEKAREHAYITPTETILIRPRKDFYTPIHWKYNEWFMKQDKKWLFSTPTTAILNKLAEYLGDEPLHKRYATDVLWSIPIDGEVMKPVDNDIWVTNYGRVLICNEETGYYEYHKLTWGGQKKLPVVLLEYKGCKYAVAKMVLCAFTGYPYDKAKRRSIVYKDGCRFNCRFDNLSWQDSNTTTINTVPIDTKSPITGVQEPVKLNESTRVMYDKWLKKQSKKWLLTTDPTKIYERFCEEFPDEVHASDVFSRALRSVSMPDEIIKPVEETPGLYVSNYGRAYTADNGSFVPIHLTIVGRGKGESCWQRGFRFGDEFLSLPPRILKAFGNKPNKSSDIVKYKDGNRLNCFLENLEWCSRAEAIASGKAAADEKKEAATKEAKTTAVEVDLSKDASKLFLETKDLNKAIELFKKKREAHIVMDNRELVIPILQFVKSSSGKINKPSTIISNIYNEYDKLKVPTSLVERVITKRSFKALSNMVL